MTAPKRKGTKPAPNPGPTDEPGQQPTPDADALAEVEAASVGAGLSLVDVAAALRSVGASASREQLDRAFTRDAFDTDIGYHEGLRHLTLKDMSSMSNLNNVLNFVQGIKAMNVEAIANQRADDSAFYDGVIKSDSAFHSGLLKAYGLETDNEVLTTAALAKMVQSLHEDVNSIKGAITQAGKAGK